MGQGIGEGHLVVCVLQWSAYKPMALWFLLTVAAPGPWRSWSHQKAPLLPDLPSQMQLGIFMSVTYRFLGSIDVDFGSMRAVGI